MSNYLTRKIKGYLGKYDIGYKYWINIDDIIIQPDFVERVPKPKKMEQKWKYYRENDKFESPILIDKNFVLVDGYTSYIIAKTEGMSKVPVYFVD